MKVRNVVALLFAFCLLMTGALAPIGAQAKTQALYWTKTVQHLDWETATRVVQVERYRFRILHPKGRVTGFHTSVKQKSPHVRIVVRFPTYYQAPPPPPPSPFGTNCYSDTWEVTWYDDQGLTASGQYVFSGETAVGYDVPLGTHVYVPGVGWLIGLDREGPTGNPYRHADVWVTGPAQAAAFGLGNDYRTVRVCLP